MFISVRLKLTSSETFHNRNVPKTFENIYNISHIKILLSPLCIFNTFPGNIKSYLKSYLFFNQLVENENI